MGGPLFTVATVQAGNVIHVELERRGCGRSANDRPDCCS